MQIEYELAGVISRFAAALLDMITQFLGIMALGLLILIFSLFHKIPGTNFARAAAVVAIFLVYWGYYIYFETAWNGQTPGKRTLRMRTVREGGLPIDLQCAAVRNLIRPFDFFTPFGLISVMLTSHNKRLGDLAAGTIVVKERMEWSSSISVAPPQTVEQAPTTTCVSNIELITPDEFEAAKRFVERKEELDPGMREQLAEKMATPIINRLGMQGTAGLTYTDLLTEIYYRCQKERGMR